MHPSLARMLRFAREATASTPHPIQTLAQLREHLDVSSQTMNNWKNRGVSKPGAIMAAKHFGCQANAILEEPANWIDSHHPKVGTNVRVLVAQEVHLRPYIVAPTLQWETLVDKADQQPEFYTVLIDDAMAPKAPAGTKVKFTRATTAQPGDAVLVVDGAGDLYFRVLHGGLQGTWEARPTNTVYPTLQSRVDATGSPRWPHVPQTLVASRPIGSPSLPLR